MVGHFTFATISYNQEEFILEHLNSIAYQIKKFGKENRYDYILADDCSTDRTVQVAERWLKNNGHLFENVIVLKDDHNLGIVGNTVRILKTISTEYFLILAADDLVYKYDILEYMDSDVIISPTVVFAPQYIDYCNLDILYELLVYKNDTEKLKEILVNRLKMHISPYLVSVFYSYNTISNKMFDELSKYRWIEDYPILNCLYNSDYRIKIVTKPLVLYRGDVGVSNNTNHERRLEFKLEEDRINKEICTRYMKNVYFNPYQYIYHFQKRFNQLIRYNKCLEINKIESDRRTILSEVLEYRKVLGGEV